MPERNNQLQPEAVTEIHPNPAPSSPFNYSIDEEAERQKALDRANDKVVNFPSRSIL